MRKILSILFFMSAHALNVQAQDIRALFVEAPDSVFPLLPRSERADCVDFVDAGMEYPVSNLLGGKSMLKEIKGNYLLLQSSAVSTVQLKALPYEGSYVICVVNTVSAEAADSRVAFFDSEWRRIRDKEFFTSPSIGDFFIQDSEELCDLCDIYLVSLKMSGDDDTIVAEYTMPAYMNPEDAANVRPQLRKIVYRWDGCRFVIDRDIPSRP